jgi:hypothetical protein
MAKVFTPVPFPQPYPASPKDGPPWDKEAWRRGFVSDAEIMKARKSKRFPWIACAYCSPDGPERPNGWADNQRVWRLLLIKRFKTWEQLENGQSWCRNYAPYNNSKHLVVGAHRSALHPFIVEYKLYDQ